MTASAAIRPLPALEPNRLRDLHSWIKLRARALNRNEEALRLKLRKRHP